MKKPPLITRRNVLAGLGALAAVRPVSASAKAISAAPPPSKAGMALASDFGLTPDVEADQSAALQKAADGAAARGLPLFLPGGTYRAGNISLTYSVTIYGVHGATIIIGSGDTPIFHSEGQSNITLRSLSLDGTGGGPTDSRSGLLAFSKCERLRLDALDVHQGPGNGLFLSGCSGFVTGS
ncbi:MAG: glycosyl hydrolase family 28-related protein, partial [Devosia sp.]